MNDDPQTMRVPSQRSSHRDRDIAFGIIAICLIALTAAWLISRNAPSSIQQDSVALAIPGVTGEQGCENFATFWTSGSGVDVPVEAIEGLTNCRLAADGTWFVPTGAADPRLASRSVPTAEQAAATAAMASKLNDDLAALLETLPDELTDTLAANYDEVNQPVFGHTKRGRTDLTVKRNRFNRIAQAYMIDPQRVVLADYVGWLIERRVAAADAFVAACRADPDLGFALRACAGIPNEFGASQIPLYWDMLDPVLINEYLVSRSTEPIAVPAGTTESTT